MKVKCNRDLWINGKLCKKGAEVDASEFDGQGTIDELERNNAVTKLSEKPKPTGTASGK